MDDVPGVEDFEQVNEAQGNFDHLVLSKESQLCGKFAHADETLLSEWRVFCKVFGNRPRCCLQPKAGVIFKVLEAFRRSKVLSKSGLLDYVVLESDARNFLDLPVDCLGG